MKKSFEIGELATRRLIIRPLTLADYPAWLTSQEKTLPALDKFDKGPLPLERRGRGLFNKSVRGQQRRAKQDSCYIINVFLKNSGELIGFLDVSPINRDPLQVANLGYFISNPYRGKGYATEAVRKVIRAAFRDLGLHRLEAVIDLDNRASIRLAQSCGLVREGIRRHYWFANGRWMDQVVYVTTPELFR